MLCIDKEMISKLVSDVIFTIREKVTGKWPLAPVTFSPNLPYYFLKTRMHKYILQERW